MAIAVTFLFFLMVAGLITAFGYRIYSRPARIHERARRSRGGVAGPGDDGENRQEMGRSDHPDNREKVPISPQDATITRRGT